MIATVHRFKSSLPGKRVELYSEMCDVFLGNRQRAKSGIELGEMDLMPAQKRRVLQPLAYAMMLNKDRHIGRENALAAIKGTLELVSRKLTPIQFLKDVEDLSGVLLERENSVYSFAHLTFQEYLAAAHIRSHRLEDEVLHHIDDSWWHETLRLYSAQGDASPIIRTCLSSDRPSIEALTLATQCMEEAFEVDPALAQRLEHVLSTAKTQDIQRLLAKQRLKLRVRKLMRSDETSLLDDSLVTVAEYQLFLNEMSAKGLQMGPDHWTADDYLSDNAAKPIEGIRGSDAETFCRWLTEREANDCTFRIPTLSEALANPLILASQSAPLHYWVEGKNGRSLVAATESTGVYLPEILHRTESDLEVALTNDLALAGAVEWARESWVGVRLRSTVILRISNELRFGPNIDIDEILLSKAPKGLDSSGPLFLFRAALRAAQCELFRSDGPDILERYLRTAEDCLHISQPTKQEILGVNIIWRLIRSNPDLERLSDPGSDWAQRIAVLAERMIKDYQRPGTTGAPLQGRFFRSKVAADLALPLFGDRIKGPLTSGTFSSYKEANNDSALRTRALIRLLCLLTSWILVGTERSFVGVQDADIGLKEGMARLLLQAFIYLTVLEERISGSAPATECLRVTRQKSLDSLVATYLHEEELGAKGTINSKTIDAAPPIPTP